MLASKPKSDKGVPRLSTGTRWAYGVGGSASGIVSSGISTFVLLYYNLALGVPAVLVSTSLAIALVFDAVTDPLVGYWSDRYRSAWGRRHPFMYFAILPVATLVYALWNPPTEVLSDSGLFIYLLCVIVPLRIALTFFDVPSNALVPELSTDYDERTKLSLYRVVANWAAVTLLAVALYGYWLQPTEQYPNGILNPTGYGEMGLYSALVVLVCMFLSAAGLHKLIPHLRVPTNNNRWCIRSTIRSIKATFSEPALAPLVIASVLTATSFSSYGALLPYLYAYFWGLSTTEISGLMVMWGVGVVGGMLVTPLLSRGRDKRRVAVFVLLAMGLEESLPILGKLVGLFPSSESVAYYPALLGLVALDMTVYIMLSAMLYSMLADVVERREITAGAREEGTIYSAQTLIQKVSSACGVWLAGVILSIVDFPVRAEPEAVTSATVNNLALACVVVIFVFFPLASLALTKYGIDREGHSAHLETLKKPNLE